MTDLGTHAQLVDLEIRLLLEGVFCHYGYDFRNYAMSSIKRRIAKAVDDEKLDSISALQSKVLHDSECMGRLLLVLSINVTSMFRDPHFYLTFRTQVVPYLRTYPFIRIWLAGCSTGEEVYSMALLLQEEGLYDRCRIYATDMNELVLQRAQEGIFPLACMQQYTNNYQQAGGKRSFSEYYTAKYDNAIFHPALKQNIVFAAHNLATDSSFNEFQVIFCRNVMIYFNKTLQGRVHNLLYESMSMFGILGLGSKETIKFTPRETCYEELGPLSKLNRKVR
ncbi:MAG: protein-glutamate O-methyltransferase CheR [Gammaproteobacteria bacterium]